MDMGKFWKGQFPRFFKAELPDLSWYYQKQDEAPWVYLPNAVTVKSMSQGASRKVPTKILSILITLPLRLRRLEVQLAKYD